VGLVASQASAGVNIEIGDVRAGALQFVQEKFDLSSSAAMQVMKRYEIMNGSSIIDDLEVPDGAVMDFVTVDGNAPAGEPMVTYEGSGIMRDAHPDLYAPYVKAALAQEDPATRAYLLKNIGEAVRRGWFIETLTPEQRKNLEAYTLPGEKAGRPKAAAVIRILVVLNNFPHWDDRSPSPSVHNVVTAPPPPLRNHPFVPPPSTQGLDGTPSGPISTSTYVPAGLNNPSWNNVGIAPVGSGASTSNHPRIDYVVDGHPGTSVDLKEDWFDFLFNRNPLYHTYSVTNYYYANSHGKISIEGNRSDIVGPLESHHMLDKVPLGGTGNSFSVQPGTPVLRSIPDPGGQVLRAITADSGSDTFATLFYGNARSLSAAEYIDYAATTPTWTALTWASSDVHTNTWDRRRQVTKTSNFDGDWGLQVRISGVNGGAWINVTPNAGWSADWDQGANQTLFTDAEILQSDVGNRLRTMCYYTHDHNFSSGTGGQAYQLKHTRNSAGRVDDVGGTVDYTGWHRDRPKPMDHNVADHATPNMGYFEGPDSNGGHKFGNWLGDLAQVLNDEGIVATGYSRRISLYPSDVAGGNDQGGTSGPWSGAHVFIPNSAVVLPVNAGLYLTAHELGHTFGFEDLYDCDFYTNAGQHPQPPLFECSMIGPYSVMAHGGRRVDAWHKIKVSWVTPVAVIDDIIHAAVPEMEGTLENPVVYKLPGRPHYIHDGIAPSAWQEYYLVENRNRNGAQYFGDASARGMYIYHVDMRFGQTDEWHPKVIVEQADGLFELESNPDGDWGDTDADPFPGSLGIHNWTQFTNPSSYSHGWKGGTINSPKTEDPPVPPPGVLQPGTTTDSFSRVAAITDPGSTMYANLHVIPREVIVTGAEPVGKPASAAQGTLDVPMLRLHFDNDSADPNMSMDDVELDRIRIDENGSSQEDTDVVRASLFDDTDGNGVLDPLVDTRIATAQFQNQVAYFTNLNYPVPLDETRDLFVAYDINEKATTGAGLSLGVGISTFDYIRPEVPGAVQERVRSARTTASAGLGSYRFPINAGLLTIDEAPDTLTVTPVSRAPVGAAAAKDINPGDTDVPILSLELAVDMDAVDIDRVIVDEVGTINAVSEITSCKLYHDQDGNGAVDPTDTLLQETTFASVVGVEKATFDISQNSVQVSDASDEAFLITCSISDTTALPSTLQLRLEDTTYIHLIDPIDIVSIENFPMESDEVSTPPPNNPPGAPLNLTATALDNGSIELAWDMSDDDPNKAGENDVTEYHVFRSADPAALPLMTEANVYAIVQVGTTTYTDINAPLGVPLYYMVRAYDGVQEGPDSNIAGPVSANDNLAPVLSAFDPADGDENVPVDTDIVFVIDDAGSGIDMTTLIFEVDGVDVANAPETSKVGSPARQTVTYNPAEDFEYLDNVAVRIQVGDLAGNVSPGAGLFETYAFTIEGPPVFRIVGTILDSGGVPEANVRVQAGALWALTDAAGLYDITGLAAGTFDVTPSKNGRSFSPVSRSVTIGPSALGIDFVSQAGYDISGIARMAGGGALLGGVTVSDGLHVDVTGADGAWTLANVPAGEYTVTARQVGFTFAPPTIDVSVNAGTGNVAGLLFEASVETFDISGTVRTSAGDRLAGIQVDALVADVAMQTTTTNLNGAYTLAGLEPGSYTVRPTNAAWAFNPVETVVNLATDEANVDFVGSTIYALTIPDGITMMAVPVWPDDPSVVVTFGAGAEVRRWDPQVSPPYLTQASADPAMRVAPGRGFWVNRNTAGVRNIVGEVVGNDENIVMNLNTGWNMGGNPYARDLPWAQVQVAPGSPARAYGFIYLRQQGSYALVTTVNGIGTVTTVPQERGFWMRASSATQVTIQGPGAAPAATTQVAARKPGLNSWLVPIVVSAAGRADTSGVAGVLPQADDAACQAVNPPAISPFVDLYFTAQAGSRLAVDVRTAGEGALVWPFEVATDMADVTVQVALPDLSEVPASKRVTLVDLDTGKRMYARTMSAYSYSSGEGGARHFALEVTDNFGGGLMITSALAAGTAAGGASVSYTLSAAAEVNVEVLNIAGRKVATLANGQAAAAGANTLTWSGRSNSGTLCPAGRYLVRIQAAADDGQRVETLAPLSLGW
jgi:hypothetical protein